MERVEGTAVITENKEVIEMIVAIATDGEYVSAHFGRCQAYTMVDIENGQIVKKEQVPNPAMRRARYRSF